MYVTVSAVSNKEQRTDDIWFLVSVPSASEDESTLHANGNKKNVIKVLMKVSQVCQILYGQCYTPHPSD